MDTLRPKLRALDPQPTEYEGMNYLYLRDPLSISERTVLVPQPLIPVLACCDGSRTVKGLQTSLALRHNVRIDLQRLQEMIAILDEACLLENETYQIAREAAQAAYRAAPFRPPSMAGLSYADNLDDLNHQFAAFIAQAGPSLDDTGTPSFRGLLSPHIDYQRGWQIYAKTWAAAQRSVRAADLAVIIGTDHYSEGCALTLTRQPYATPFGLLPIPEKLLAKLVQTIGEDRAFTGELHHRSEHSIELATTWLHYFHQDRPIEMLPVLAGQLESFAAAGEPPAASALLKDFTRIIQQEMQHRRVIIIAAGDLAHVGPAFGGPNFGPHELQLLQQDDSRLLTWLDQGAAEPFYSEIETGSANNNVCGASPIYLMLRILGAAQGQTFGYSACPADQQGTSFVTIAGAGLY